MSERAEQWERFDNVWSNIEAACKRASRPVSDITLVAVTKRQSVGLMNSYLEYCADRGRQAVFGENYVQEWQQKKPSLSSDVICHCIGPLQRNKAKLVPTLFQLVETAHSLPLLEALHSACERAENQLPVYLQVNISGDDAKSGFAPAELSEIIPRVKNDFTRLELAGLMTITRFYDEPDQVRPDFEALRDLRDSLVDSKSLALSMGMSADYPIAIEAGATVVRVGTALFGQRES